MKHYNRLCICKCGRAASEGPCDVNLIDTIYAANIIIVTVGHVMCVLEAEHFSL